MATTADRRKEDVALAIRAQAGDRPAMHELFRRQLLWIRKTIWGVLERRRREEDPDVFLGDAYAAFEQAIATYDPAKGSVSTHLYWSLRGKITRAIDDDQNIRIPPNARYGIKMKRVDYRRFNTVPLRESITARAGPAPEDRAETRDQCRALAATLGRMKPREREIVESRARGQTLAQIGERFGITQERVRTIAIEQTQKLRREFA